MKQILLAIALSCITNISAQAQNKWDGAWQGKIDMANLRIVFNVKTTGSGSITVTMDSPDQSAFGLPVETAQINADSIFISDKSYQLSFSGKRINDSTINGVFTQGANIPMVLKRSSVGTVSKAVVKKQTPVPPFPYKEEEVMFQNTKAGVTLSGTLTIPPVTNGAGYPAVVLVSGSGPQDRDETIFGHKPFAVLADHLTRAGMVVLRYDDRGTVKSTGDFSSSTTLDFAGDAGAAVQYLLERKEVDKKRIGIIGHSEGGMIAPMVANEKEEVDFIVLLAGPGVPVVQLMSEQNVAILRSQGMGEETANQYGKLYSQAISVARTEKNEEAKIKEVEQIAEQWAEKQNAETVKSLGLTGDSWQNQFASAMVKETSGKWMQYFLNYAPEQNLRKLQIKVLALNGDKDNQVLAKSNLAGIEAALKKSKSPAYKTLNLAGLNHLFQTCNSCTVAEYGSIEETFSPLALDAITTWLKNERILKN